MKILEHHQVADHALVARTRADLDLLLAQPTDGQVRPCDGCAIRCACKQQSTSCTCQCSSRCPEATRELSTEPDRYPIEPGALPVVYGLASLRVMPPCWSCEGHIRNDESILRLPQVWFHADSITYPQLLLGLLDEMAIAKELKQSWRVSLSAMSKEGVSSTYALEPQISLEAVPIPAVFCELQSDFEKIGDVLNKSLRARARRVREKLS